MNRYLVEHNVTAGSKLTVPELEAISQQSQLVVNKMEQHIELLHTTVTNDRMVCLYSASNEHVVREFSRLSGLPIRWISQVSAMIGPERICSA